MVRRFNGDFWGPCEHSKQLKTRPNEIGASSWQDTQVNLHSRRRISYLRIAQDSSYRRPPSTAFGEPLCRTKIQVDERIAVRFKFCPSVNAFRKYGILGRDYLDITWDNRRQKKKLTVPDTSVWIVEGYFVFAQPKDIVESHLSHL